MAKFYYFVNEPGVFFIETASRRLSVEDAEAYAARELEINSELLEKAVAAGRVGTVADPSDFFEEACDKHLEWVEVCEQTLAHILELTA